MEMKDKKILFVCMYGQSRSRWFAEKFMKQGIICNWCGYAQESMITINQQLLDWADEIVLLDKDIERETRLYEHILESGKIILRHYLDDEPRLFEDWLQQTGLRYRYLGRKYINDNKEFLERLAKK